MTFKCFLDIFCFLTTQCFRKTLLVMQCKWSNFWLCQKHFQKNFWINLLFSLFQNNFQNNHSINLLFSLFQINFQNNHSINLLFSLFQNHFQNSQANVETFEEMLLKNPTVFHPTRTAKSLQTHWLLMRQYHLLPDQTGIVLFYKTPYLYN
jgi:hypothetical protein